MRNFRTLGLVLVVGATGVPGRVAMGATRKPPAIEMSEPQQFIAPGNTEAVVHSLQLPFSTITFMAEDQVIKSWTFTVFDTTGKLVSKESRLETRDRGFFGELFNIGPQPQLEVPKELTWMGRIP